MCQCTAEVVRLEKRDKTVELMKAKNEFGKEAQAPLDFHDGNKSTFNSSKQAAELFTKQIGAETVERDIGLNPEHATKVMATALWRVREVTVKAQTVSFDGVANLKKQFDIELIGVVATRSSLQWRSRLRRSL